MNNDELLEHLKAQTPKLIHHKHMNRCLLMIDVLYSDCQMLLSDANILADKGDVSLDTLSEVSSFELSLQKALCTLKKQVQDSLALRKQNNDW